VERRVSLIVVTDPRYGDARILEVARACANVDGFALQLRDRTDRTDEDLWPLARELRAIVPFLVVNRRIDLARRVRADGVHGEDLPPDFAWRSSPAHDAHQLQNARILGANAALVSPIFASPKVTMGKDAPRGVSALREARAKEPEMTLVALGGVDETNARACRDAGADAVAVIRAIFESRDPAAAAARLL
jgi:thiamine-phosphate pyrophosphorylase